MKKIHKIGNVLMWMGVTAFGIGFVSSSTLAFGIGGGLLLSSLIINDPLGFI